MPNCPRCEIPLNTHSITTDIEQWEVDIDVCSDSCGGVWIQDDDFSADSRANLLLDLEIVNLNTPKRDVPDYISDQSAVCPDCHEQMTKFNWNNRNVYIDTCKICKGRWFDGGEIRGIYEVLKAGG